MQYLVTILDLKKQPKDNLLLFSGAFYPRLLDGCLKCIFIIIVLKMHLTRFMSRVSVLSLNHCFTVEVVKGKTFNTH